MINHLGRNDTQNKYGNKHFPPSILQHEHIDCCGQEKGNSNKCLAKYMQLYLTVPGNIFRALEQDTY